MRMTGVLGIGRWCAAGLLTGLLLVCAIPAQGAGGKLVSRLLEETLEVAARRSGRVLNSASKSLLKESLLRASAKYGDDVLLSVRRGGLEVLEQGVRHGDRFWHWCRTIPEASRSLALHADELMPLAERIGPETLRLEAKIPGAAIRGVREFGDDGVLVLAKQSPENVTRLIGYAEKADSPATKKLLLDTCAKAKDPSKFLDALNWKNIMAAGLSSAAILSAAKISGGLQKGLENPETAERAVGTLFAPVRYGLYGLLAILLLPLGIRCIGRSWAAWKKNRQK